MDNNIPPFLQAPQVPVDPLAGVVPDVATAPVQSFTAEGYEPPVEQPLLPQVDGSLPPQFMTKYSQEVVANPNMPAEARIAAGEHLLAEKQEQEDIKNAEANKQAQLQEKLAALGIVDKPKASTPAVATAVASALQPTKQDIEEAAAIHVAPIAKAQAQTLAKQAANEQQAGFEQEQQQRIADQQLAIAKKQTEIENQVRMGSLAEVMQGGSFGSKLGAILAVGLGSLSQGLLRSKSNPAIDMFEKMAEQQASKDKLDGEQLSALKKSLYDEAAQQLDKQRANTDSEYKKQMIDLQKQELLMKSKEHEQKLLQGIAQKQAMSGLYGGAEVTPDIIPNLTEFQQKSLVNVGGKQFLSPNGPQAADKFREYASQASPALALLKKYQPMVEGGGWRTLGQKGVMGYFKDKAAAQTMEAAITGALRLPYLGPGAMTEQEYTRLKDSIGKYGLWNLPFAEAVKVDLVIKDLEARLQGQAQAAGIKAPVVDRKFVALGDGRMQERSEYIKQTAVRKNVSEQVIDDALKARGQ